MGSDFLGKQIYFSKALTELLGFSFFLLQMLTYACLQAVNWPLLIFCQSAQNIHGGKRSLRMWETLMHAILKMVLRRFCTKLLKL